MSALTESDSHTIKLSKRCVSCWARHRLTVVLATQQLFASAEDQQSTCAKNGCFQTRWFGTRYCYRMSWGTNWHPMPRYDPAQISSLRGRQAHLMSAASKQWTSSQDIQLAMSRVVEIRAGHRQVTDLVILISSSAEVVVFYRVCIRMGPLRHIGQAPSIRAISIEISLEKRFNQSVVVQEARFFWLRTRF